MVEKIFVKELNNNISQLNSLYKLALTTKVIRLDSFAVNINSLFLCYIFISFLNLCDLVQKQSLRQFLNINFLKTVKMVVFFSEKFLNNDLFLNDIFMDKQIINSIKKNYKFIKFKELYSFIVLLENFLNKEIFGEKIEEEIAFIIEYWRRFFFKHSKVFFFFKQLALNFNYFFNFIACTTVSQLPQIFYSIVKNPDLNNMNLNYLFFQLNSLKVTTFDNFNYFTMEKASSNFLQLLNLLFNDKSNSFFLSKQPEFLVFDFLFSKINFIFDLKKFHEVIKLFSANCIYITDNNLFQFKNDSTIFTFSEEQKKRQREAIRLIAENLYNDRFFFYGFLQLLLDFNFNFKTHFFFLDLRNFSFILDLASKKVLHFDFFFG